jgi:transposase
MVIFGVDAHKQTHTIVALDMLGRVVATVTVAATVAGHLKALRWAEGLAGERRWALEDCRHLTRRLEADLLRAGEEVVRVPPKLMAGARRSVRQRGKSDPIDAESVARAALREPNLPVARLEGEDREVRLLVDHREDLVAERTRIQNRLRWHLHELGIDDVPAQALDRYKTLDALERRLAGIEGLVAEIAVELVGRCRELTRRANELERHITARVVVLVPSLIALTGCGALTAGKLLGEAAGIDRFRSKAAFAAANGTAPIPVWSGNQERFRLNRGGNRQVNAALHRIIVTQLQSRGPARDYVERRMAEGKTKTEAIRALRRRMSDVVYRLMMNDLQARRVSPATTPVAQAA